MNIPSVAYRIPDTTSYGEMVKRLHSELTLHEEQERDETVIYYDSFDWRFYHKGAVIEGRGRWLLWRDHKSGAEVLRQEIGEGTPARFPQEWPEGELTKKMAKVLGVRALLPRVEVANRVCMLRLLNKDQKTVVRLYLIQAESRQPGKSGFQPIGTRLMLSPVKGYRGHLQRLQALLEDRLGLSKDAPLPFADALAGVGEEAGSYSSKIAYQLTPKKRSDIATKEILSGLLDVMEANVSGTQKALDSEFLHDLRVAVRRTRSALSQIKGVFVEEEIESFKRRFSWVGKATGPTRDLDVYLLNFDNYRRCLPKQFRKDLDPLHHFLQTLQVTEQEAMAKKLRSPYFRALLKEWRAFLDAPVSQIPLAPDAVRPIQEIASRRIYKMYKRVLKHGNAITNKSEPERFHDLRKECKKLRYLLEFFKSLYPKNQITPLISALKKLLDNLGNFQDLEVQAEKLCDFAHQMVEKKDAPADTLLAMGMLVESLLLQQQDEKKAFSGRFEKFSSTDNSRVFKELFTDSKKGKQ